jgi:hypothetical protein
MRTLAPFIAITLIALSSSALAQGQGQKTYKRSCQLQVGAIKTWLKIKNPNAPAATRAIDGTF